MKKIIPLLITLIVSALITIILFEAMSWYHFGDIPTRVVLLRLLAFFFTLSGILICIVALILKKRKNK